MSHGPVQWKQSSDAAKVSETELRGDVGRGETLHAETVDNSPLDEPRHLSVEERLIVGDYPLYTKPICDDDPSANKPRTYHLVVDLVYSAMLGKMAGWVSLVSEGTTQCYAGISNNNVGCTLAPFLLTLSILFHWWRLNIHLVWYDNKQSVLTDIFLVGDNVCMLGITTILADTSIGTDTIKFDILTLLTLYVVSDGLIWIQQVHQLYINRKLKAAFVSFGQFCVMHGPGFIFRLVWSILMYTGDIDKHTSASWNWTLYGVLLDTAGIGSWLIAPHVCNCLEGRALPLSIPFMDARIARIMTIVVSLLLTSGILPNWHDMSSSCRIRATFIPSVLVFSYLPYMVTFDRDPQTGPDQHAIRRSTWSTILYLQASMWIPTLVVLLAAKWQRLFRSECGVVTDGAVFDENDRWTMLMIHATIVLISAFRFLLHLENPNSTCRWSRKVRIACRCAAAFAPMVLSASEPPFSTQAVMLLLTNLFFFFFERYGRVTFQDVAKVAKMTTDCDNHDSSLSAIDKESVLESPNPLGNPNPAKDRALSI